ncbi:MULTISPECIES: ATP-binding protein [unclassified Haloferax]|jgi:SpoVK/Ycf46/Vps4 family AAA+-type ATPase|uniref:ATP-binding protein n=1 Tax=unclassified Haloferax TaxID=2625095 RepID=UPI0028745DDA|nr:MULTISPECIES: ATP-binding protein [unclassified Haloferax]MDS0243050.1 ATP-binding protein [Haloferax sp. S2CR25]MDS0446171.1 ATP-binding protein [Haloferax sp. S2CR25-2]
MMDGRESNTSTSSSTPTWGTRAKDTTLLGVTALVVVATHIYFPLLISSIILDAASWSGWGGHIIITGIGLVLGLAAAAVIWRGSSYIAMYPLALIEGIFYKDRDWSVLPFAHNVMYLSIGATFIIWTAPIWQGTIPGAYSVIRPLTVEGTTLGTWFLLIAPTAYISRLALPRAEDFEGDATEDGHSNATDGMSTQVEPSEPAETTPQKKQRRASKEADSTRSTDRSDELTYDWESPPDLTYQDVGGYRDVTSRLRRRAITPLTASSDAYTRFGVSPPTGILLYGPPGTGKSHLARATAGELGFPYLELSQADLTSKWINESAGKVRQLFDEAEQFEHCVIFIDEIDSLLRTRQGSGHSEDTKVVSEFLARLEDEDTNYLLIAASNQPDLIDDAIRRPGRFDEQFEIGLPDAEAREEIFRVQLRERHPSLSDEDYRALARKSDGLSAADIEAVANSAAFDAAEQDAPTLTYNDLNAHLP